MKVGKLFRRGKNEDGAALIIAIIVLGTLSLMALAAILTSNTEVKIARNVRLHTRAFWAAEAGVQWALTLLNTNMEWDDPDYFGAPYTSGGLYDLTVPDRGPHTGSLPDGSGYEVRVGWKRDLDDLDHPNDSGDSAPNPDANYSGTYTGANELVYYNPWYRFPDSPADAGQNAGFPIQIIRAIGRAGSAVVNVTLEVGRSPFDVHVKGAVTATSNISVTGNITVSGYDHDLYGNPTMSGCGSADNLPAVSTTTDHNVASEGSSTLESGGEVWTGDDDYVTYPNSPEEALGLTFDSHGIISGGGNPLDTSPIADHVVDPASAPSSIDGLVYITGDYAGPDDGRGILIVHNPMFDPTAWDVSVPVYPDSAPAEPNPHYDPTSPNYDPKLDPTGAYDSIYADAREPATLGNWNSHGVFQGVVIADRIGNINGTPTIIGAMISLTSVNVGTIGNGTAKIFYSCEAIQKIAVTGFNLKIAWTKG